MNRPEIRTQAGTMDHATSCLFNSDGKFSGASLLPRQHTVKSGIGLSPQPLPQFFYCEWEKWTDIHQMTSVDHLMHFETLVKPLGPSSPRLPIAHHECMDRWPQRSRFIELTKQFANRNNATNAHIAKTLGISLSYLQNLLYREVRVPGWDLMVRAAELYGVPTSELVDDPNTLIAGEDLSEVSSFARFLASVLVKDVNAKELTDDDRLELYEDWQRGMARIRKRKSAGGS